MLPAGIRRLFRVFTLREVERDVDAEIGFHLEQKARELIAGGMHRDAARAEALRQFGDRERARADLIEVDRGVASRRGRREWLAEWLLDARHAARGLARTPGLTAAVLLMLGLGIGGASAMFGLMDRVLFSVGAHIQAPDELQRLYVRRFDARREHDWVYSASFAEPILRELAKTAAPERDVAILNEGARDVRLGSDDGPELRVSLYSGNAFEVLGTRFTVGRPLHRSDDDAAALPVAVISHGFWQRHFGGTADAVGRTIRLGPTTYTVVGVAPKGFSGLRHERVEAWLPLAHGGETVYGQGWQDYAWLFEAVVRLPRGADASGFTRPAEQLYRTMANRGRGDTTGTALARSIIPWRRPDGATTRMRLTMIVGGVAAMLCFIAVANATNLLLLRAVHRRRETAVRIALGAGRGRLVRSVLMESTMLALAGAAAAGVVAGWGGELLRSLIVRQEWQQAILDPRVLGFAGGLGLLIGIVTGLVPGLQASRPESIAALKAGVRGGSARSRLRSGLLVIQAALTVALIVGLGLYTRSFARAVGTDYVVDADRLLNVYVYTSAFSRTRGDDTVVARQLALAADEFAREVRAQPGVAGASRVSISPIFGYGAARLRLEGVDSLKFDGSGPYFSEVDEHFLAVSGIPVLAGRGFTEADVTTRALVSLVNDEMARKQWPGQNPLGKCLYVGGSSASPAPCRPVVGVVSSYRNRLQEEARMQNYYVPLGYEGARPGSVLIRTTGRPEPMMPQLSALLRARVPGVVPDAVRSIGEITRRELDPWKAGTTLFALFAGLAVVLAMGGLYSVVAYGVAQRTHEFSIRIAVGARASDLVKLVLATALRPVVLGLVIGLALALWLVRFLSGLLYETSIRDPLALAAAVLFLLGAAAVACIIPSRRAARTDPREALQAE